MATINDLTIGDTEGFYSKHKTTVQSVMMNLMECPPAQLADLVVLVKKKTDPDYTVAAAKELTLEQAVTVLGGTHDPLDKTS